MVRRSRVADKEYWQAGEKQNVIPSSRSFSGLKQLRSQHTGGRCPPTCLSPVLPAYGVRTTCGQAVIHIVALEAWEHFRHKVTGTRNGACQIEGRTQVPVALWAWPSICIPSTLWNATPGSATVVPSDGYRIWRYSYSVQMEPTHCCQLCQRLCRVSTGEEQPLAWREVGRRVLGGIKQSTSAYCVDSQAFLLRDPMAA